MKSRASMERKNMIMRNIEIENDVIKFNNC